MPVMIGRNFRQTRGGLLYTLIDNKANLGGHGIRYDNGTPSRRTSTRTRSAEMAPLNTQIAARLREMSDLLRQQGANPFRVSAYRRAAESVLTLAGDLAEIFDRDGEAGLVALPDVGKGIAGAIAELIRTGRWSQLERLRGTLDPERLFQTVPGIGAELARRIHDTLHIDTLEAMETAAYDGRLERVRGFGPRRVASLQASLAAMLRRTRRAPPVAPDRGPAVALLLEVDRQYRQQAEAGQLPLITPRRFNPQNEAWLPVLHLEQGGWHFTAMYSNTARAHQLGRTRDWVVIYFYDDHHQEGQQTVVSETRGPLLGQRVVRGREPECRDFYQQTPAA